MQIAGEPLAPRTVVGVTDVMIASMRALLSNVIDYAGLFPPAKLPMEASLLIMSCIQPARTPGRRGYFSAARVWRKYRNNCCRRYVLVISAIGRVAPADGLPTT